MCSRHFDGGAGAEYLDPRDRSCDYCAKDIYDGSLRSVTIGGSTSWLCGACFARQQERFAAERQRRDAA